MLKNEAKTKFLGPVTENEQEIRVLNRTLRWIPEGIEHKEAQRHQELIIRGMNMENVTPTPVPEVVYTEGAKANEDSAEMSSPMPLPAEVWQRA